MRFTLLLAAALLSSCSQSTVAPQTAPVPAASALAEQRPTVTIMIGLDGFRSDYLDPHNTPNLYRLARAGVQAKLQPSFPTKTFPNFYTLVTGLRPDRHGIVGNRFEDPNFPGQRFTQGSMESHWWNGAEPIWIAAERAGIRTASLFWPGDSRVINGMQPSDFKLFDQKFAESERVSLLLSWLERPVETRPRLLTIYFDTVDTAGHHFGPNSPEAKSAATKVDAQIGRLVTALDAMGQRAHLIIASDHGMMQGSANRYITLSKIADPADYRLIESGPYAAIEPQPGREAALEKSLLREHAQMRCWRRENLPAHFEFGKNPRAAKFLCLGNPGWLIGDRPDQVGHGHHGWEQTVPEMAGIFITHGPAIRSGLTLPTLDNIHVAPFVRLLAGIPQAKDVDGDVSVLTPALRR